MCGATWEIDIPPLEGWTRAIVREHHFYDVHHVLELTGGCPLPRRAPLIPSRRGLLDVLVIKDARAGGAGDPPYDSLNAGDHVGDDPVRVRENLRRVADTTSAAEDALVIVHQVHGCGVVEVHRARRCVGNSGLPRTT